jgi:hypothetical protein
MAHRCPMFRLVYCLSRGLTLHLPSSHLLRITEILWKKEKIKTYFCSQMGSAEKWVSHATEFVQLPFGCCVRLHTI